jgi:hypothetical protein
MMTNYNTYKWHTAHYDSDKRQAGPLVWEGTLHWENRSFQTVSKIWSCAPGIARHQDWPTDWLAEWMSDWLTVGRNVIQNLVLSRLLCLPPAFLLVSCSAYFLTMKMHAICFSETSFGFQWRTRHCIPKDSTLLITSSLLIPVCLKWICASLAVVMWQQDYNKWIYLVSYTRRAEIAQSVERRTGRPEFDSRQGQVLYFLYNFQTGSVAHPATYPMGTGGSFPGAWRWPLTET